MLRRLGGCASIGRPLSRILPSLGVSNPAMQRKVVVFPQPLGPSSETNSPGPTLNDSGPITDWAVKRLARLRTSSSEAESSFADGVTTFGLPPGWSCMAREGHCTLSHQLSRHRRTHQQ